MKQKRNNYIKEIETKQSFQLEQGINNQQVIVQYPNKIWPFWVQKQFDPDSSQFNSTSNPLSANNTTCRNWTQLGFPFSNQKVLVDPTGLITPLSQLWSLESWVAINDELHILSKCSHIKQYLSKTAPKLLTRYKYESLKIDSEVVFNPLTETEKLCINQVKLVNTTAKPLQITFFYLIRPYNPEGVSQVKDITYLSSNAFIVNKRLGLVLDQKPDNVICSNFDDEDLSKTWNKWDMILQANCAKQMGSALASFTTTLAPEEQATYSCKIPLADPSLLKKQQFSKPLKAEKSKSLSNQISQYQALNASHESTHVSYKWEELMKDKIALTLPDKKCERLFRDSCHHVLNFTSKTHLYGKILPFSNKIEESFDILLALNQIGFAYRASHYTMHLPALKNWVLTSLKSSVEKAKTILSVATTSLYTKDLDPEKVFYKCHFLAKSMKAHLGKLNEIHTLSDYIWILGAYQSMFYLAKKCNKEKAVKEYHSRFVVLKSEVESFAKHTSDINHLEPLLPVTESIIHDSRLLQNLASVYPLNLYQYDNKWIINTLHYLESTLTNGLVFKHQGAIGYSSLDNIYLAQAYVGTENKKAFKVLSWLNQMASGTGAWPESIHPQSKMGSAGNGHFGPSSAAYISLILKLLIKVRDRSLYILPFIPKEWFAEGEEIACDNCPTPFGTLSFKVTIEKDTATVSWTGDFHTPPKDIVVCSPKPLSKYTFNSRTYNTEKTHLSVPPQVNKIELHFS
jgi:hypothetical protein